MTIEELIKELEKYNLNQKIQCIDAITGDFCAPTIFFIKDCLNNNILVIGVKENWDN